ncbi:Serine acetyltransferase [Poriferisphaera corsica]|uniref:Serine acetyltransferase n=1 Tax=Poriferisphaera corsica TaxID=2528020 RepID=A0A517YW02_9BACT|nr:acyltransferase [Poriferisphaera corsica]QDU34389.1 Serine acetyltransferase [Poriferisphaera corsica]
MDSKYKPKLKLAAQMVGLLRAAPTLINYRIASKIIDKNRAFSLAAESVAAIPGLVGVYARYAFYKQTLAHCGKDVCFGYMSIISKPDSRIGEAVCIGRHVSIGLVDIGHHSYISDDSQILSGRHQHGSHTSEDRHEQEVCYTRVIIGSGSWIGANAVIMDNVGRSTIVGAGSVVTKPIKPHDKVVGVPARSVKVIPKPKANPTSSSQSKSENQTSSLRLRPAA